MALEGTKLSELVPGDEFYQSSYPRYKFVSSQQHPTYPYIRVVTVVNDLEEEQEVWISPEDALFIDVPAGS